MFHSECPGGTVPGSKAKRKAKATSPRADGSAGPGIALGRKGKTDALADPLPAPLGTLTLERADDGEDALAGVTKSPTLGCVCTSAVETRTGDEVPPPLMVAYLLGGACLRRGGRACRRVACPQ